MPKAKQEKDAALSFQDLILKLERFWVDRSCVLQQPYDVEVGAGTMAPETFCAYWGRSLIEWCMYSLAAGPLMAAMARILIACISIISFK